MEETVYELKRATKRLEDIVYNGGVDKLKKVANSIENSASQLSRFSGISGMYEVNQLIDALKKFNDILDSDILSVLNSLSNGLDIDTDTVRTLRTFCDVITNEKMIKSEDIDGLVRSASIINNSIEALGNYVHSLYDLERKREQENTDIKIQNLLRILNDDTLMQALGLTKEDIVKELAKTLNSAGLPAKYIATVSDIEKKEGTVEEAKPLIPEAPVSEEENVNKKSVVLVRKNKNVRRK